MPNFAKIFVHAAFVGLVAYLFMVGVCTVLCWAVFVPCPLDGWRALLDGTAITMAITVTMTVTSKAPVRHQDISPAET